MNALNKLGEQIRELFNSMTAPARIMAGLMVGVIVISLGWILSVQQSSDYEYLLGGRYFSDDELARAEQALGQASLPNYIRDGNRIRVPSKQKDAFLKALADGGAFPREQGSEMAKALSSSNPFEPTDLQNKRYESARERTFEAVLKRMPGIDFAAVEYDEKRTGFAKKTEQTANISVQSIGNRPIDPEVLEQIAEMATTYFAGVELSKVTVKDLGSANMIRGNSDPSSPSQNPLLKAERDWEAHYHAKLMNVLSNYGRVKLGIKVDIDPTLQKDMETLKYDPTTTTVLSSTSRKDSESSKPTSGGRPGTDPNAISNTKQSISQTNDQSAKTKEIEESQRGLAGYEAGLTKQAGLVPKKVSVTVGVPESYYSQVWNNRWLQKNPDKNAKDMPPLDDAEKTKLRDETKAAIESAVLGQLPEVRQGDDRFPLANVYTYHDLPSPRFPEPSLAQTSLAWMSDSWSTIGLFLLAIVSLLMMFSWVRSQATAPRDQEFARGFGVEVPSNVEDSLDLGGQEQETADGEEIPKKFQVTGGEMKEEISGLIKQNPEAAVNLLRTWIGDAA